MNHVPAYGTDTSISLSSPEGVPAEDGPRRSASEEVIRSVAPSVIWAAWSTFCMTKDPRTAEAAITILIEVSRCMDDADLVPLVASIPGLQIRLEAAAGAHSTGAGS